MAKVYKNKYAGLDYRSGASVEPGAGWIMQGSSGKWVTMSNETRVREGHAVGGVLERPIPGGLGSTMKLSVADTWRAVFIANEARADAFARGASDEKPWTDDSISQFMRAEFPAGSEDSKSASRVSMYRGCYNRGTHSFSGRGEAEVQSSQYAANGKPIGKRSNLQPGLNEQQMRQIAKEESANAAAAVLAQVATQRERPIVEVRMHAKKAAKKIDSSGRHARFVDVLKRVEAGVPVMLVGPAGCGKTHLTGQVANALDLPFTFNSMSEGVNESHLLGRMLPAADGSWEYRPSPFVHSFQHGGVHLFDEIDAADPNLLVTINAAIANGLLSLPFAGVAPIKKHEDCHIVAAANTFGTGADRQYSGRNQLDAATVDRFKMGTVELDYDRAIEEVLAEAHGAPDPAELTRWAWGVRDAIGACRMRRIMSTRNIIDAAKLLSVGLAMSDVRQSYFAGWTSDELAKVGGAK